MGEESAETPAPQAPADEAGQQAPDQQGPPATGDEGLGEGGQKALAAEREAARTAKRELAAARRELEQFRKAQMSDTERAIAEARETTAAEVRREFGTRLVRAEFAREAATAGADATDLLEYLDLARFVGDDGEPDTKAIQAAVAKLPKKQQDARSFDGGARGGSTRQTNINEMIHALARGGRPS